MTSELHPGTPAQPTPNGVVPLRTHLLNIETWALSAVLSFAIAASAAYADDFTSSRLLIVLLALFVFQLLRDPRLLITRELVLYILLTAWLCVAEIWSEDPVLGLNTLFWAFDFIVIFVMVSALLAFADVRSVIYGATCGILACSILYGLQTGFPAQIPHGFSYNAFATMYLYGLVLALLYGWSSRSRVLPLALALLMVAHVAATTSIKANLGIALGALSVLVFYRRQFFSVTRRYALYIVAGASGLTYLVLSNEHIQERMKYGWARLGIGIQVLSAREDQAGYVGFNERRYWFEEGLRAWTQNPLFGHGTESFRVGYGITSHSAPVDLLYNTGLIGFVLYYAIHASLAWRILDPRCKADTGLRAILLAGLVAYTFMTLSGTIYYLSTLAVFFAACATLLSAPPRGVAR
jgi:O-antigen ligase